MLCILFNHACLASNIRHIPFGFDAQQATHIPIRIFAFVVGLGMKAGTEPVKKVVQVLRRWLDFIQGYAPVCDFSDLFESYIIPSFMPCFRLFGEVS